MLLKRSSVVTSKSDYKIDLLSIWNMAQVFFYLQLITMLLKFVIFTYS